MANEKRGRPKTAGKNIQKMRVLRDLTQEDLGKLLGVSRSTVAAWEVGKTLPADYLIPRLQDILHAEKAVVLGMKPLRYELANVKWTSYKPSKSGQYLVFAKVGEDQTKYFLLDYNHRFDRWEEKNAIYINPTTGRQIDSYQTFSGEILQWTAFPKSDMDL